MVYGIWIKSQNNVPPLSGALIGV